MKKKFLGFIILSFMLITLTGCGNSNNGGFTGGGKDSAGNTSGNLANRGLVVENKDYIYHSLYENNGIYKLSKKENSIFKSEVFIPDIYAYDLNIVDDYLYYVVDNPYYDNTSKETPEIRKTKLDGSDTKTLAKVSSGGTTNLNVTKDYIYYSDNKAIYKMSINGGESQKVYDIDASRGMYVTDGWIYYAGEDLDINLGRVKTDGSDNTKLFHGTINKGSMIVEDDYVYFYPYYYNGKYSAHCKVKADGTGDVLTTDIAPSNIYKGLAYYSNGYTKGYSKSKLDGSDKKVLIEKTEWDNGYGTEEIFVTEDWVYVYMPVSPDSWAVYQVKQDGSNFEAKTNSMIDSIKNN